MKQHIGINLDGVYEIRFPYSEEAGQYVAFMSEEELAELQADIDAAFKERGSIDELALENKLMRARNERLEQELHDMKNGLLQT